MAVEPGTPAPQAGHPAHPRSRAPVGTPATQARGDPAPSVEAGTFRWRNAELRVLSAVAQAVNCSLDLPAILEQALAALLDLMHCTVASIVLVDWETQEIEVYTRRRAARRGGPGLRRFDLVALRAAGAAGQTVHPILEGPRPPGGRFLAVPLAARGRTLGLVGVALADAGGSRTRRLLAAAAAEIGTAVENARLYQRAQREADRLAAVNAVGSAIRKSLRVPALLDEALRQLLAVTDLEFGVVFLHEPGAATPAIAARSGISEALAARLAARLSGQGAAPGLDPVIEEDLPRPEPAPTAPRRGRAPRCSMHIPLHSQGRLLGVMTVGSYSQRHFAPGARDLLAGVASHISLALENACLYEQTQHSARRLEALNAVATAANETLEIDSFLRAALPKMAAVADLGGVSVFLVPAEDPGRLAQAVYHGDPGSPLAGLGRQALAVGSGGAGRCAAGRSLVIEPGPPAGRRQRASGAVAYLPLQSRGRLIGVLAAASRHATFSAATTDLLQALAGQLAIGLDNALLYRETQERAQELAQMNEALREAMRGKDQFMANVTHELKRPIAPARMVLETLLEVPPDRISRQRQEALLRNALSNMDSLDTLVSELLDAVRLERQSQPFAQERFDLRSVVRRSVATMRPLAEARDIKVHSIIPATAINLCGDAEALGRVVSNLLSNAIKFNRDGGSVLLQLERTAEGKAVLEVTDTGIGIPAHARPHIFERFYQADSSSTRAHEGLGLGLFIARGIVEHHGGEIRFETEEGQGTTFTVVLPLAREPRGA